MVDGQRGPMFIGHPVSLVTYLVLFNIASYLDKDIQPGSPILLQVTRLKTESCFRENSHVNLVSFSKKLAKIKHTYVPTPTIIFRKLV